MSIKENILKIPGIIRDIVNAPFINILLITGVIFIVLSFCQIDIVKNELSFHFIFPPAAHFSIIGISFVILSIIVFSLNGGVIIRKANIKRGISFKFKQIIINIKVGEIETLVSPDRSIGVVLPANTSFIDDCIIDSKSALGAFMLKHFPDKIAEIQNIIMKELETSGYKKNVEDNAYLPSTTIILPEPYNSMVNVIITAATVRKRGIGINSSPAIISDCIKMVFEITADKKISTINMPIIGSGHGGLEINFALLTLIFSIWYFSKQFHHLRQFNIVVTERDAERLKDLAKYICLTKLD